MTQSLRQFGVQAHAEFIFKLKEKASDVEGELKRWIERPKLDTYGTLKRDPAFRPIQNVGSVKVDALPVATELFFQNQGCPDRS